MAGCCSKRFQKTVFIVAGFLCAGALVLLAQQRPASPLPDDADQPIKTPAQNPDAVAVVIGISEYQDMDIPRVAYAVHDAEAVRRVLTQTLGYVDARILLRTNNQVSIGRLKPLVRQTLASLVKPGQSDVFFYYSGHGMPNANTKEGYLIPADFDSQLEPSSESAYSLKELYADLGKLGARSVTVMLEACFSGQTETGTVTRAASPAAIDVDNPAQALANGVVITASGAREIASWHPDKPHGLMTYYWLRAMRGEAGDNQGRVTPAGLRQYLQEKVSTTARQSKQRNQTPEVVAAQPDRALAHLPVSALRTGDARVVDRFGGLEVFIDLGGDLSIDGILQGTIRPGGAFVNERIAAGPHHIEVRKDGYETKQEDIVIVPDQTTRKTYLLTTNLPTTARLDRVYGLIQVSVDRGGALYIDNKKEADLPPFAPYTTPRIEAGSHQVRVERPGYVTFDQELLVRPNDTARLELTLTAVAAPAPPTATGRPAFSDFFGPATRDVATGMEFLKIQPGEFMMGCSTGDNQCVDDEKPAHRVRITKGFEIEKYEVTQEQWQSVMGSNPSNFKGPDRPVEQVSWNDVQEFLQKLNARQDGYRYRLPTEAEWEYAARSGSTGAYAGSLDQMGWYDQNSGNQTHPVGQKQPNAWGLYDIHGNVSEWVQDWYGGYTNTGAVVTSRGEGGANIVFNTDPRGRGNPGTSNAVAAASDPAGSSSGQYRVVRGGSWNDCARNARVSLRDDFEPTLRDGSIGFRCVREAIP